MGLIHLVFIFPEEELFHDIEDLLTDDFLLAFVRGRKYCIDKATKTVINCFLKIYFILFKYFMTISK